MTKTIIMSYVTATFMVFAFMGVSIAGASEITGILSSSPQATTSENINGTVSGTKVDGNSSGNNSGGGSLDSSPSGAVLGASSNNELVLAPSFPNAGSAPNERSTNFSVVRHVAGLVTSIVAFMINLK